jgi:Tol biopolymer transport system component
MKTIRWVVLAAVVAGCEGNVNNGDVLLAWTSAVSTNSAGGFVPNGGGGVSLSADGRLAAFSSGAAVLVAGDTNLSDDVFVKDLANNAVVRVSVDSAGAQSTGSSSEPSLSANGGVVAFSSTDGTLVPGDVNGQTDIFVRDLASGTTELVSVDTGGGFCNGFCSRPSISGDGRFVAFQSTATDLHADDADAVTDIFVRDRLLDATILVSRATGVAGAKSTQNSLFATMTPDGSRVAFLCADTLDAADVNAAFDAYVRVLASSTTILASRADGVAGAVAANGAFGSVAVNGDGTVVAFASSSTNLVAVDTNNGSDIFVRNLTTGSTVMASVNAKGEQTVLSGGMATNPNSDLPAMSADGGLVAFWSNGQNLVDGDTNARFDVFVKDLSTGAVVRANVRTYGAETFGDTDLMAQDRLRLSFSQDGRFLGFGTSAGNLGVDDINVSIDGFVRGPLR